MSPLRSSQKEGRLTDAETAKVKMCVWYTSVQTVQDQKTILTVITWRDKWPKLALNNNI